MLDTQHPEPATQNWNARVTKYFVEHYRLTLLLLVFVVGVGIVSTLLMRTTGFPNPDVNVIVVQTAYVGASAETVEKNVSIPIEGVIKNIDGVDTVTSRSSNSFSVIVVNIKENTDVNDVRSKIDASIRSLSLPEEVEESQVSVPTIAGPDLILSVSHTDVSVAYEVVQAIQSTIESLPETSSVTMLSPLEKTVRVTVDTEKLRTAQLTLSQVQGSLQTIGESIPAASGAVVGNISQNIFTLAGEGTLEDIRTLQLRGTSPLGGAVTIGDIASVDTAVTFVDSKTTLISYTADQDTAQSITTTPAIILNIDAVEGTEVSGYQAEIEKAITSLSQLQYVSIGAPVILGKDNPTLVIEQFSGAEFNNRQVSEVISGLVGGPLPVDSPIKHVGWLLGGIQLVFLVMLAFVSWRAALVAAISMPLSLIFSNIYLYSIGEDLNTLVLFSLVLVIGLVVDPALVILESIQRKVDTGLRGKAAAIAAVNDVGNGLFLATLTNIIVFVPFALISGILGQIFAYIPLTVVPAVIGSYVVPLIFLAWFGSRFLKKGKHTTISEEDNIFFAGKWLIRLNTRILKSTVFVRTGIIVIVMLLSLGVAGYFFGSGKIAVVQFSSTTDADYISIVLTPYPQTIPNQKEDDLTALLNAIQTNPDVLRIFPLDDSGIISVRLVAAEDRETQQIATQIAEELRLATAHLADRFYDYQVRVDSVGPPLGSYQIALAVTGDTADSRKQAVLEIGKSMALLCEVDNTFSLTGECSGNRVTEKVDDSYTDKEVKNIEVKLNRQALAERQLVVPNAPLGVLVNAAIQSSFKPNVGRAVSHVTLQGEQLDIVLDTTSSDPHTLEAIRDIIVAETPQATIRLRDVADVQEMLGSSQILHVNGEAITLVQARVKAEYADQATIAAITQTVLDEYQKKNGERMHAFELSADDIGAYSEGSAAADLRSFQDLLQALVLAIVISYIVLAVFFNSFTQPLLILYTIPLTFLGIFPGLRWFATGEFGFLEIIGLIILVGLVENVAIFLIDAARYKIKHDGWEPKRAIAYASGVRLRPVLMTKFTAIASLLPLAILSDLYRPISIVIMAGLLTSGFTSLITTPILYIYFQFVSDHFWKASPGGKLLWPLFWPIMSCAAAVRLAEKRA